MAGYTYMQAHGGYHLILFRIFVGTEISSSKYYIKELSSGSPEGSSGVAIKRVRL